MKQPKPKCRLAPAPAGQVRSSLSVNDLLHPPQRRQAAFDRTLVRALESLPDSVCQRKQLLEDLVDIIPTEHRRASQLRDVLSALYNHNMLCREFLASIREGAA